MLGAFKFSVFQQVLKRIPSTVRTTAPSVNLSGTSHRVYAARSRGARQLFFSHKKPLRFPALARHGVLLAGVAEAIYLSQNTPVITQQQHDELREEMILDIKRSVLKIREGLYREAEDLLHIAMGFAKQIQDYKAESYILDMLANIYFEEKKYRKAEETFKEVLRRELSTGRSEDNEAVIEISAKLAKIYAEQGHIDKAKLGFDFCLEHLEKKLENVPEDQKEAIADLLLKVVHWGSEFFLRLEDKAENSVTHATSLIEKGLDKAKQLEQTGSEAYQLLANNLSTLYAWQHRVEEAISVMKETINLAVASEHWSLASFYLNLAHIYAENNDLANAEAMAKKALETGKKNNDAAVEEEVKKLVADLELRFPGQNIKL
ncbi:tetratricopeptide repeat protein 19 homolog, mitochondrial-like [Paramacrobiotus metropolitanus]|uniref:tetratricopeptide repeat protein 19 homolog, mitochondrial-like n=1 Tax=Paramacrobiotus metropolitanus TaxID=2943436 RepID=UPI0024459B0A|nr:tetratricopeptide repeat protein 19 homolog, mitochondrial-like [Paramacrobiotus metropolitanus]